ncbi:MULTISPECIES: acetyl-CoA carboxylase carboxyltransferase subunit alpha [Leptolyngbya]|uniref:Acetyl-coenzyme A carboxylase carboxyl transferase subunit alpha n=1 Tax=Leptolyngbya boryana CZ1 TaxID=3060204 RepID=A0AA97AQL6_LEPBY|nr:MULTISPECIES: acetyl-CoA carboxylase carboxyltransferase subunit alpha [Leptolyngbya]MBD1857513.1 acetyl-CoA carboxylase carboxyltransferase subunit alpha [Leptolyngbya sp. FACHB-1624]MBN8560519.1 acetyl-CoA carboxylase carboxyltransferase subunit alpha [Leptolyngbya sp. UWPOB_LEPTO1]MCY6489637.1 acetyl-CoA carboxylase carboxyltransferase subunit alpha [Leptolyngbya sp. GGD]WNZ47783.1 acetyl-CoA carboxylase carboxyltransferase subunit alpha [Leptolyngbya boryana CZ1]
MPNSADRRPILLDFEKPLAELEARITQVRELAEENEVDLSDQIALLEARAVELRKEIFSSLTPGQRLQVARHPRRPSTLDYIQAISDEWMELHGDRGGHDDPAVVGGVGRINGRPVVMLGQQKGRNTKDNIRRNFGQASPSGYRKAIRLMEHADRFGMPILTFIDTPAAWAGLEAEQFGQGEAIAYNLREMFGFEVPIICSVIGEGGSGGALAIGVGERLLMFEHAVYSVAPPETCATILWRDSTKSAQAAEALKITAPDLKELGIADEVLPEPIGGAHNHPLEAAETLKTAILRNLAELDQLTPQQRRELRYQKFRSIGVFTEAGMPTHV